MAAKTARVAKAVEAAVAANKEAQDKVLSELVRELVEKEDLIRQLTARTSELEIEAATTEANHDRLVKTFRELVGTQARQITHLENRVDFYRRSNTSLQWSLNLALMLKGELEEKAQGLI